MKKIKKITLSTLALTALIGTTSINAADAFHKKYLPTPNDATAAKESTPHIYEIFSDVKFKGQIRPRLEMADVKDNALESANALTARIHLSATAGLFEIEGLSATIGVQSINNMGYTNYSVPSTNPKKYDVINDPQAAMLSEASIDYKVGETALHAGRSQLNLDNQRFIGTVGWRQLERSYDTISVTNKDIKNLELMAAYLYGYAGVGGTTTTDTNSAILHAKYTLFEALSITAYDYMLGSHSDTLGVALEGKSAFEGAKLDYHAEFALQKDPTLEYQVENVKADAFYYNLDLGANISGLLVGINYEFLSGTDGNDGKTNFKPSLGTNHKFNGWADVFYVGNSGPTGGLEDLNARLGYANPSFGKVMAIYHDFSSHKDMAAASGTSTNLGSELDLVYSNKISLVKGLSGLIKYASYSKGDVTSFTNATFDKQVFWAELDYKF